MSHDTFAPEVLVFVLCTEGQKQRVLLKENIRETSKSKNTFGEDSGLTTSLLEIIVQRLP